MANKNFIVKNGLDVGGLITGTTTTQSASDNTTKLASTAYVTTALANLADSAPSTLNTLNELAAALGDDANFSTTVTNSIATKLPLAGGTITGDLRLNTTLGIGVNASSAIGVYLTKSLANGLAAELSNTESSTGSGLVVKGGNNSSTYSADFRDYNNNSLMRIRGDGNVGIGTNSPLGLLSIKGTGDAIRVESTNTGAGGAQIDLLHYTTSPADNDIHGAINFGGYYSGSSSAYGSAIRSVWSDVSAKEAQLEFFTRDDSDFAVRMIVDKDGNVGIGGAPDSSGRLLVTNGGTNQIVLKGSAGTTNLNMGNFVGGGYISNNYYYSSGHQTDDNSKGAFEVFIGDSEYKVNYHAAGAAGTRRRDFAINSSGKVGIGTDSPTEKLTVAGAITTTGALSDDRTSTGSMDFVSGYTRFVAYGASGERGAFTFNTAEGGSSSSQKVVIDGLGRIGVGTTAPQTMIHIKTTSPGISFTDTNSFSDTNDRFQIRANSDNGQFQWYDDSTGTTHTHMTITQDGNIGIGQTTPYVSGTNFTSLSLGGSSGRSGLTEYKYSNNASKGFLYAQSNALTLEAAGTNFIRFATNGAFRGAIDSGGTLYFGDGDDSYAHNNYAHAAVFTKNSTPDGTVVIEDMDVSTGIGNTILKLYFRDADPITHATFIDMQGGGNGRIGSVQQTDAGTGVVYNTSSDYRLKENVNYDWDATTLLKQLKPAKFNFISKPSNEVQGFLAHEVSDLVPSSVSGEKDHIEPIGTITDSDGDVVSEEVYEHFCKEGQTWSQTGSRPVYQQIDHSKLVPLLTKAIQEQQTIIEDLKTRIETLEG